MLFFSYMALYTKCALNSRRCHRHFLNIHHNKNRRTEPDDWNSCPRKMKNVMLFREKRSCFRNGNSARIKNGIEYSVSQRKAFPNTCQFIKLFLSGESQTDTLQMLLWFPFSFVGCRRCIHHFSGGWYHPPESRQPVKN